MELTEKLTGWFDVREYRANTPKEQQRMKSDDQNITFSTTFDDCPPAFAEFAKPYTDGNGNRRFRVSFKIGARCRWFDGDALPVDRPTNAELDGVRFEVRVQYNTIRPTNPNDEKAARGYWANAVQFEMVNDNPFDAFAPQRPFSQQAKPHMQNHQQAQPPQMQNHQQAQPQMQNHQQAQQHGGYQPPMPPPLGGQMPPMDGNTFDGSGDQNLPF